MSWLISCLATCQCLLPCNVSCLKHLNDVSIPSCLSLIVRARCHWNNSVSFFSTYIMFLMDSGQFEGANFISDVCQLVGVEHFFLWHEIQDGRQKI